MQTKSVALGLLVIGIVIGGLASVALMPSQPQEDVTKSGVTLSDTWYDCIEDGSNVIQTLRFNLTSYEPHTLNITIEYEGWVGTTYQTLQPLERKEVIITQRYPGPCLVLGAHIA